MEDDVYERLVRESISRYGTAKGISRVLNEELRGRGMTPKLLRLLHSKKIAKVTAREFEEFRKELSYRLER